MDRETSKDWERPWTTDEIREHSANWNLAGDSGLLNHLQQFSQNLLTRTHATEVALDKLVEDLKGTSTSVENATNTFLFLANTQFVENRVYDDDEKETPPEEKKEEVNPPKSKEEQETEVFENIKKALHMGLAVLDTHFEAVEVPASDSEEEESSTSVGRLVLKAKNPYLSRPLPYLIGSREFMEDDKVGLGEIYSDTEESPDQNIVQSSESDDEMEHDELIVSPKRPVALSSSDTENSEPESDRSETKQKKLKTNSSVRAFGEGEEDRDMFGHESPPEADGVAIVKGGMKSAFSDELSSKLATTKPQILTGRENENDNIFVPSSEPENETGLFGKTSRSFTEKQGLFGDLDDWQSTSDSLWKDKSISSNKPATDLVKGPQNQKSNDDSHISGNQDDGMFIASKHVLNVPTNVVGEAKIKESTPKSLVSPQPIRDVLFGAADETEDLFSQKSKVPGSAGGSSALFGKDELEDEDLFAVPSNNDSQSGPSHNSTKKKKLPGAVPVFSDVDLFGNLSPVVQQNSIEEYNVVGRNVVSSGSDLHQESSSGIGRSKDMVSKRDGDNESQEGIRTSNEKSSLFDSQKLFQNVLTSTKITDAGVDKSSLFNTEVDSDTLFDKQKHSDEGAVKRNIAGSKISASSSFKPKTKKTVSLFDDSDSGDDELLFSSTSSTSSRSRRSQGSGDFLSSAMERRILPKKGLFEDNLLFGAVSREEPDVDIFSSHNNAKSKGESLAKDNIFVGDDVIGDSSSISRKVTSNIFDDIDDVDDIFAVPKRTVEKTQSHASNNSQAELGKLSLFSDASSDVNNIFSNLVNESKRSEKLISSLEEPSDTSVENSAGQISGNMFSSSPKDSPPPISVLKNENKEEMFKNTKPTIREKPKVPMKPPPSSVSVQGNSKSLHSSSNVLKIEKNVENSQNILINDAGSQATDKMSSVSAKDSKSEFASVAEEGKVSDNQTSVSCIKPEPPRTLNIRKTTDIVFGSPSNDDDLFESSWSGKSSVGKENEQPKDNTLISNNFSKLLDGFSSNTVNSTSTDSKSREHSPNNSPASGYKQVSSISGDMNSSDVGEPQKATSSPCKLSIDPRTLLPGARPPSMIVISDGVVGFDKPAETSTLHSAGKERVKIQVKRRPQTRRARQEALRASSIEYDNIDAALISQISNSKNDNAQNSTVSSSASTSSPLNTATPKVLEPDNASESLITEKSTNSVSEKSSKNNFEVQLSVSESEQLPPKIDSYKNVLSDCLSGNSNALSPLTDEEDLFAVPHELPFDDSNNKEIASDSKNLFGGAPVLSPLDVKTRSDSFSSQSALKSEHDKDILLSGKEENDFQNTAGNPIKSDDLFEERDRVLVVSTSPTAPDKNCNKNMPSVSNVEDRFMKHLDSKWLDHDLEKIAEDRGLFDNDDDEDRKGNGDGSDDDLFSSVKKPGKKSENDTFSELISQKSPLFSPEDYNTSVNVSKENVERKQSFSEDFVSSSTEGKLPIQKDMDTHLLPTTFKNVSSVQIDSDGSPVLFPKRLSHSPQRNESDDLFTSNIIPKDGKSANSIKNTDSIIANTSQEKVKLRVESLFGDDSIESDDLFGSSSSVPKMSASGSSKNLIPGLKSKDTKGILFDDGDDDDDIFTVGLNKNRGPKGETLFSKEENSSQRVDKDADDLFSIRSSNSRNQGTKPSSVQKVQSFEDPLMVFNK